MSNITGAALTMLTAVDVAAVAVSVTTSAAEGMTLLVRLGGLIHIAAAVLAVVFTLFVLLLFVL